MNESILLAAMFFPAAAAVIIFFMKYLASVLQARARIGQDEAYRALLAGAQAAQADTAAALTAAVSQLADIRSRLGVIEKILKDVE